MVTVHTISQLQETIREGVQEMLAIGGLADEIKNEFKCPKGSKFNKILRQVVAWFDMVDSRNTGRYEGLILSFKLK